MEDLYEKIISSQLVFSSCDFYLVPTGKQNQRSKEEEKQTRGSYEQGKKQGKKKGRFKSVKKQCSPKQKQNLSVSR